MKNILLTFVITIFANLTFAQSITNISPAQRTDGSMITDIYYDLNGPEPAYTIAAEISFNAGSSFAAITNFTGDAGAGITPGTGKHIIWNFGAEFPGQFSNEMQIRITASLVTLWSCGQPLSVTHTSGDIAPVNKTVNYGTVETNLTGSNKCWITQNLGSDQQATAATDATEPSAGWYWQFNRKQGYKHDGTTLTPAWTITSINENSDWLPENDPCSSLLGSGWRLPTYTEWNNADINGGWYNYNQPYASVLKLHAAGSLNFSNGSIPNRGSAGGYWSSTQGSSINGWYMTFDGTGSFLYSNNKAYGFTNRCLTDVQNTWSCGEPLIVTHASGDIAPVNKTVNYGTVQTNLTGSNKCWITQNLGSDQQAVSATDGAEASAGWYWQFNRKQGYKHDGTTRTPNTPWISPINENSDWLIANDPCALLLGAGWRLPTYTEWNNADVNGGWNNYDQTYASVLKLHAAGYFDYSTGFLGSRGSGAYYWSNTLYSSDHAWSLAFNSGSSYMSINNKANGFTGRCLSD